MSAITDRKQPKKWEANWWPSNHFNGQPRMAEPPLLLHISQGPVCQAQAVWHHIFVRDTFVREEDSAKMIQNQKVYELVGLKSQLCDFVLASVLFTWLDLVTSHLTITQLRRYWWCWQSPLHKFEAPRTALTMPEGLRSYNTWKRKEVYYYLRLYRYQMVSVSIPRTRQD